MLKQVFAEKISGYGGALVLRPSEPSFTVPEEEMTVGDFLADPARQSGEWLIDGLGGFYNVIWTDEGWKLRDL